MVRFSQEEFIESLMRNFEKSVMERSLLVEGVELPANASKRQVAQRLAELIIIKGPMIPGPTNLEWSIALK